MGNCECLQGNEENQQIDVRVNDNYNRDYTSPGNYRGGKFVLMENESEENDQNNNKLRFQSYKDASNNNVEEDQAVNSKFEVLVDDNRVEPMEDHNKIAEKEQDNEDDFDMVDGGNAQTQNATLNKKNLVASYKMNNPVKNNEKKPEPEPVKPIEKKEIVEEKQLKKEPTYVEEPPKAIEDDIGKYINFNLNNLIIRRR